MYSGQLSAFKKSLNYPKRLIRSGKSENRQYSSQNKCTKRQIMVDKTLNHHFINETLLKMALNTDALEA
jgi:hypothetical protein